MSFFRARFANCALRIVLPAIVLTCPTGTMMGQAAPQPAHDATAPQASVTATSITTTADEVSLDLFARTKRGKPVADLRTSDLVVTDNGTPVKLSDMHLVTGVPKSDHLVTLLFDRLEPGPAKAAREIATKMLRQFPPEGYTFAVLKMDGRLRLLHTWTSKPEEVLQAVNAATGIEVSGNPSGLSPAEKQLIARTDDDSLTADFENRSREHLLLSTLEESQRTLETQHDFPSLSALSAIVRSERQITGRKLVIYFTQGLNAGRDARDAIRVLTGQANRGGVTICSVDTNAMNQQVGDRMMGAIAIASAGPGASIQAANNLGSQGYGRGQSGPPIGQVMDAAQNMSSLEFDSMDNLKSPVMKLASETGGIYLRAGASSKHELQELHQNLTSYYEASYVPNIRDYNGAFRPIAVQALRKGIVVRTRSGYFALPPDNGSGMRPFEAPLLGILDKPMLPTEIEFQTAVLHLGRLPDGNSADLAVQVPVSQLKAHEDATTHLSEVHATIVARIKDAKGAIVERFSEDVPLHEAPDVLRNKTADVITMQRHFSAEPGTYTLEAVVFDPIGNKAGAQRSTFSIDAAAHGPALSDLSLVRTIEPLHEELASFEPMRYLNGRIVPDLANELPEKTRNVSVFFLVHALPPSAGAPQLTMQIFRNGESLGIMPLELHKTDGAGAVPYLGTIGGHTFPPGNYKIEAKLAQGGETATSSTTFSVEGTIAASTAPTDAAFSSTAGTAENAERLEADQRLTASAAVSNSRFAISSPANPLPPPTEAEVHEMIEGARQRALTWSDSLPNFLCLEVTDHAVDPRGEGEWQHKDTLIQMMRYLDHQESRTTVELNGRRSQASTGGEASSLPNEVDFAHSNGEFGGMFVAVFDPAAKAKFTWKEADILDGQSIQVFDYSVDAANSAFDIAGLNNAQRTVGFHGEVYIDPATHSIRRITINADNIPENLKVQASSISVDYDWVSINRHEYLMPSRGAVSLREGKRQAVLNQFAFRDYRRFGSQVRILPSQPKTASNAKPGAL